MCPFLNKSQSDISNVALKKSLRYSIKMSLLCFFASNYKRGVSTPLNANKPGSLNLRPAPFFWAPVLLGALMSSAIIRAHPASRRKISRASRGEKVTNGRAFAETHQAGRIIRISWCRAGGLLISADTCWPLAATLGATFDLLKRLDTF